jgi:hypothetical protein
MISSRHLIPSHDAVIISSPRQPPGTVFDRGHPALASNGGPLLDGPGAGPPAALTALAARLLFTRQQ